MTGHLVRHTPRAQSANDSMSRKFGIEISGRTGRSLVFVALIFLGACAPPPSAVPMSETLDVLPLSGHFDIQNLPPDWVVTGDVTPTQISSGRATGYPMIGVTSGAEAFVIARRTDAHLAVTPFLHWAWSVRKGSAAVHPVRILAGIRSRPQDTEKRGFLASLMTTISGTRGLPAHDRLISVLWGKSALQRGMVSQVTKAAKERSRFNTRRAAAGRTPARGGMIRSIFPVFSRSRGHMTMFLRHGSCLSGSPRNRPPHRKRCPSVGFDYLVDSPHFSVRNLVYSRPCLETGRQTFDDARRVSNLLPGIVFMPTILRALLFVPILALSSLAAPAPTTAADGLNDDQRREIEKMIEQHIMDHPEVVMESIKRLQDRMAREEEERAKANLVASRDKLISDPSSPVGGNPDGDVTIVEFFDYRCGFCKRVFPALMEVMKSDPKVRYVFKEFPILGPESVMATKASLAVWRLDPEKYMDVHAALLEVKGGMSLNKILKTVADAGADPHTVAKEMDSPEIEAMIRDTYELADSLRITGTPAFVIGDELVPGAVDIATIRRLIAKSRGS